MRPLRILCAYSDHAGPVDQGEEMRAQFEILRSAGLAIDGEPITLEQHGGRRLAWRELDERWRRGDPALMHVYERLARRLEDFDCLLNYNGINLHPEFVRQLPVTTAYAYFDDPESSAGVSRPVAAAYDLCLVGNIAEVETYRQWGARNVRWWPLGFRSGDFDPALTHARILEESRPLDVGLLCERWTNWRRDRLDRFAAAFPQGVFRGTGWPGGRLAEAERIPLYQRCRIGPNFHNSTGPINFRTFTLPANGVMQICDNRSHLGRIFELGKEVIGFDHVDEAIDACRYYLAHEDERRVIAAAGFARAHRDYNVVAVFRQAFAAVAECRAEGTRPVPAMAVAVQIRQRTGRGPFAIIFARAAAGFAAALIRLRLLAGAALRAVGLRR